MLTRNSSGTGVAVRLLSLAVLGLLPAAALAQTEVPPATPPVVAPAAVPANADTAVVDGNKFVNVTVGRSTVLQPPWPVKRVSVTDPKVADIQVLTPQQVLVSGKSVGSTDLFMWSATEQVWQGRVDVEADRASIRTELTKLFPTANLDVRQSRDMVVVSGTLSTAEQSDALRRFLTSSGVKFVDMTTVAGVQQVQIKVLVAEASRKAIRTLGINAVLGGTSAYGASVVGSDSGGPINPISIGQTAGTPVGSQNVSFLSNSAVSQAVTMFGGIPSANLEVFIQALAENQYLRVLAEPSLVALSGQEASFLAGGEFPIPVVQGAGASTSGSSISVQYKEFGVRLRFRPTVLGDGVIRLHVAPEVSQLSNGTGSVQINGFSIPALLTRRAETTLEMGSGQTFAMAGLLNQTVAARSSGVPGFGDIPVLGALFRSVRYEAGDTELVVLVTASLAEPTSRVERPPVPGDMHVPPNDWELYAMGNIEGKIPPKVAAVDAAWMREQGLDRLKGPGAWATFDSPAAPSRATMQPAPTKPAQ